ncbi:MAG: ExbD/TolR family protein [Sandaracinaceae bacterium]
MPRLTPQQRVYIRKHTKEDEPDPSEEMGELNIVPFLDIVVNIIIFLLATTQVAIVVAEIEARLPPSGAGGSGNGMQTLNLTVTVTDEGIVMSGSGGHVSPNCQETRGGSVVTVPKTGPDYTEQSFSALNRCAARIKEAHPDEDRVIVSADPQVEFRNVVRTMDALRNDGTTELFPNLLLSAGGR